jgi:2'-5' RNA ligase
MRCSVAITPDEHVSAAMNELRQHYDAHYRAVVPHLTVAFPEHYAGALDTVRAQVAGLVRGVPAFTVVFDRWASMIELLAQHRVGTEFLIDRYPNAVNLIVLLAGQGAAEILALRRALSPAIPQPPELLDYPPYGTIGQSLSDAEFASARQGLRGFQPRLEFHVRSVDFYAEQPDGSWPVLASLPLALA